MKLQKVTNVIMKTPGLKRIESWTGAFEADGEGDFLCIFAQAFGLPNA